MKISKKQLRRIIREEHRRILYEMNQVANVTSGYFKISEDGQKFSFSLELDQADGNSITGDPVSITVADVLPSQSRFGGTLNANQYMYGKLKFYMQNKHSNKKWAALDSFIENFVAMINRESQYSIDEKSVHKGIKSGAIKLNHGRRLVESVKLPRHVLKRIIREELAIREASRDMSHLGVYAAASQAIDHCIKELEPQRVQIEMELLQGRRFSITIHQCVKQTCIDMGCEDDTALVLDKVQGHFENNINLGAGRLEPADHDDDLGYIYGEDY